MLSSKGLCPRRGMHSLGWPIQHPGPFMATLPSTGQGEASLCCTVGSMSDRPRTQWPWVGGGRLRVAASWVPRPTETYWNVWDRGLVSMKVGLGAR